MKYLTGSSQIYPGHEKTRQNRENCPGLEERKGQDKMWCPGFDPETKKNDISRKTGVALRESVVFETGSAPTGISG